MCLAGRLAEFVLDRYDGPGYTTGLWSQIGYKKGKPK